MKVNDLSLKIVTSTGKIVILDCVRALNSLQNAMMLIPCGPSAVPTGGAGFAASGDLQFHESHDFLRHRSSLA